MGFNSGFKGLNVGECLMSVEDNLCFRLLSRNKIKIYAVFKTLPLTSYGPETWFADLRKDYGLNVFENRAPERNVWNNKDGGENYVIGCFIFFTPHQMLCYWGDRSRVIIWAGK